MYRSLVFLFCGVVGGPGGGGILAVPKADVGTASSWALDFKFHDPQRITLRFPGDAHLTTFWYMVYEVTNHTGEDRGFYPSFHLVTDTLQVVEGGADVNPSVYDAIAARHKDEFPFLAPPPKVTGLLLQGEENARASVAVFRMFDSKANGFTVYVSGLSGEIRRIRNPGFDPSRKESESNLRFFVLRRTLAITYDLPGDPNTQSRAVPIRRTRTWVMR
ncbi:MAG: hypothetical protein WBE26_09830 [Phycisphaerae bacterium]